MPEKTKAVWKDNPFNDYTWFLHDENNHRIAALQETRSGYRIWLEDFNDYEINIQCEHYGPKKAKKKAEEVILLHLKNERMKIDRYIHLLEGDENDG